MIGIESKKKKTKFQNLEFRRRRKPYGENVESLPESTDFGKAISPPAKYISPPAKYISPPAKYISPPTRFSGTEIVSFPEISPPASFVWKHIF